MAKGKVSINSDVVNQALSQVSNSCTVLESNVSGKIPGNFQVLSELGLLPSALTKLQQQLNDLISVHKSIASQMTSHLDSSIQTETDLYDNFTGGYTNSTGTNNYGGGGGGTSNPSGSGTEVDNENDGQKVNADALVEAIPKIDNKTMFELLKFLNINKNEKSKLIDLLLDTSKSEELFVLLRKAFGEDAKLEDVTLEDYKKVQKTLLDAIITSNVQYQELDESSILTAKEYLVELSKNENIKPSDLLLDDSYKNTLQEGLKQLYDGDGVDNISTNTIDNFRKYVDNVATNNQTTAYEVLSNNLKLLL